jgi:trehalose 6-phosphate synthase
MLINPYDSETFADTLAAALEMPREERMSRLRALRGTVEHNNIYRWAAKVLTTLTAMQDLPYSFSGEGASPESQLVA